MRLDPNLFLLIIGGENTREKDNYLKDLKNELSDDYIKGKYQILGRIDQKLELSKLYQISDLFVFPSKFEGTPNVILEAMASKLPIIAEDEKFYNNILENDKSSILLKNSNSKKYAEAIYKLVKNKDMMRSFGVYNRNKILKNHKFSTWENNLVKIYNSISN